MGDVVNLSKHRKTKERALRQKQAEANRQRFGRTKGERLREEAEAERADEAHALLKFETPEAPALEAGEAPEAGEAADPTPGKPRV
jgi:hypothetical protein